MKMLGIASFVAASAFAHCGPLHPCDPGSTRCSGSAAEICNARGSYDLLADCDEVSALSGEPFVCAPVDETNEDGRVTGHTCVSAARADAEEGAGQ